MVAVRGSELPIERAQDKPVKITKNANQNLTTKVKASWTNADKITMKHVQRKTKVPKLRRAPASNGFAKEIGSVKVKRKGRPILSKNISIQTPLEIMTGKVNDVYYKERGNSNYSKSATFNGENQRKLNRRTRNQKRNIPLVPPAYFKSSQHRVRRVTNVSRSTNTTPRYKLKRVGGRRLHYPRANRHETRTRTGLKTPKRTRQLVSTKPVKIDKTNIQFMANFWAETNIKAVDLSSVECGSYSDCIDEGVIVDEEDDVKNSCRYTNATKARESFKPEDLDSLTIPEDYVFNPRAKKFIPRKKSNSSKYQTISMEELVESVKGQQLPRMPI